MLIEQNEFIMFAHELSHEGEPDSVESDSALVDFEHIAYVQDIVFSNLDVPEVDLEVPPEIAASPVWGPYLERERELDEQNRATIESWITDFKVERDGMKPGADVPDKE